MTSYNYMRRTAKGRLSLRDMQFAREFAGKLYNIIWRCFYGLRTVQRAGISFDKD